MNSLKLNHAVIERAVGDMAPASTRLRSRWKRTFRAYDVQIHITILRQTASRVCGYSMIHELVHVSNAVTAHSTKTNQCLEEGESSSRL